MNLQYYSNYVTIVEEGSLTAAARKLRIAQPALSNQIKALETAYGARLFYRGARRLELTDAGTILYQKAKWMCEVETSARNEIASGFNGSRGTLRVGITSSFENEYMRNLLRDFSDRYPDTEVRVFEADMPELAKKLQNGVIEAMLIRVPHYETENMEVLHTQHDDLVAAYRDGSFFQDMDSDVVTFEQLENLPLSVLERSVPAFNNAFKTRSAIPTMKFVSTRMTVTLMWARLGKGIALVPKLAMKELGYGDLKYKTIVDNDLLVPSVSVVAQRRKYRSQVINNFLALLAEEYNITYDQPIFPDER